MRIIIEKDYQSISKKTALLVSSQVLFKPNSILGFATGSTSLGMYLELIKMYKKHEVDFSRAVTFNLDEYYRISPKNPNSYHYYMEENFFKYVNFNRYNNHIPDGMTNDIEKECFDYDNLVIQSGGIDLQVLGIGSNGHIGFNEPAERLNISTHLVDLSNDTIQDNSRFFGSLKEVPKQAISMGIGTILKAKQIILLASGINKAEAIKKTVNGYINTWCPSSLLQIHPHTILIIDQKAASLLESRL
jgi:glucosamine-6-phosphate deaminase